MIVYEDGGGAGHAELARRFKGMLDWAAEGKISATGDSINEELDVALAEVYVAATEGGDVVAAKDKALILFYDLFPSGS